MPSTAPRRDPEAAYTLVEAAASIAVLALLAIIGAAAIGVASKALDRDSRRSKEAGLLLRLEAALDRATGRVTMPFWLGPPPLPASPASSFEIRYVGGDPAAKLAISFENGFIIVRTKGIAESIGPFDAAAFSALVAKGPGLVGVDAEVGLAGRAYSFRAVFGSIPLMAGTE
jgi:type II secretory pathway pseudopilin PulG